MTTAVTTCTVESCSFNHEGCSAPAITIAGSADHAACATFISLDVHGGLPTHDAAVGACQRLECSFNHELLCTASNVTIGSGHDLADCLTYTTAA